VTATPLDLRTQQFKTSIRGFDRREVSEFVASLATRYDEALRDADRLRDDLGRTQALVEEQRNLRATLMTAQKLADEIRLTAEQESQRIIGDAQAKAAALVQGTAPGLEALAREVAALRARREQTAADMASTVAALRATLDAVRART
jgi:cell division initiation protein